MSKLRLSAVFCVLAYLQVMTGSAVHALPPLGITTLGKSSLTSKLSIVQGKAYVSTINGHYFVVDSAGSVSVINVTHPSLGSFGTLSKPVEALDGEIYFVASNRDLPATGGALYHIDAPDSPLRTWEGPYFIGGVDQNLRVFGDRSETLIDGTALWFNPNSTATGLLPTGSFTGNTRVNSVTPNGYILGGWQEPGTEEYLSAYWDPDGNFYRDDSFSLTIQDRADGKGINIGSGPDSVKYGDLDPIKIVDRDESSLFGGEVLLSQTNFTLIRASGRFTWAYYPGVVPENPDAAVRIKELFPELADFPLNNGIWDLFAVDGRIYMTFVEDGTAYLFGARDPSLGDVPEPSSLCCLAIATLVAGVVNRRRNG
ncbi:MAG: hypothetical protein KDA44_13735 [Planctomycetales bacterium]|nr:hypothetical protein [Planctomycetales bacterium]